MNDQIDTEDYVLVPKRKAKLSRARKSVIGFMVVGAIAAVGGGGTFASFSASTTNDASFSTARLALRNGTTTACVTPSATAGGTQDAAIDSNNVESTASAGSGAADCPTLFEDPIKPGATEEAIVTITNVGDEAGDVSVFTPAACDAAVANTGFNAGDEAFDNICTRIDISIENTVTNDCIFPVVSTEPCAALGQGTTNASFADFGTGVTFGGKRLAFDDLATNAPATFSVKVRMKITDCSTAVEGDPTFGFADGTGNGCDNGYMNQKALMNLRWQMQA